MKKILSISVILISILYISCGPSADEKAVALKAHDDSVSTAARVKMETKLAFQDSVKLSQQGLENLNAALVMAKGDLAVAKDRMAGIREFQFGRTTEEREQQIRNQTIVIDELEKKIHQMESDIPKMQQLIAQYQIELTKYQ